MRLRPSRGDKDTGSVIEAADSAALEPEPVPEADADSGLRLQPGVAEAQVAVVIEGRPAGRSGIAPGDVLVAIDGLRATAATADAMLRRAAIGRPLTIHAFRRDELMTFEVIPEPAPADTCEFSLSADATAEVLARRAAWLGVSDGGDERA